MSGLSFGLVSENDRAEWERVARSSDNAWMGHTWAWNVVVEEGIWEAARCSIIVREGSRALAIVPLHLKEQKIGPLRRRVLHSNAWGTGGVALLNDLTDGQRALVMAEAVRGIHETAQRLAADKVVVRMPPLARRLLDGREKANPLVDYGFRDRSTMALVLRLAARDEAEVWAGMETRCRNAIRKAERSGVSVSGAVREESADAYYALHLATYERTGARPHPRRYFDAILGSEWSYLFYASLGARIIAALNVGLHDRRAFYWTGASLDEARSLGANNLLQWHAIRWLLASGVEAYELGEVPDASGRADPKLVALARFKQSFGGSPVPFFRAEYVYARRREAILGLSRPVLRRLSR